MSPFVVKVDFKTANGSDSEPQEMSVPSDLRIWPLVPTANLFVVLDESRIMISPLVVIGSEKPVAAFCQEGKPVFNVRTWPLEPTPNLASTPLEFL